MIDINTFDFSNKKVLVRVDFNVPMDGERQITDDTRILSALPTIERITSGGGVAVLMSHLGRPKGEKKAEFSLEPVATYLQKIVGASTPVSFVNDCIGEHVENIINEAPSSSIILLENLRFYSEEEKGDVEFAKALSRLGDVYINDAFGTAHRAHASTTIVAQFFKENKGFGYLLAKEIDAIQRVLTKGKKPITAILGGAKISTKIVIIEQMLEVVDHLIIGGGMTYTFVKAMGGKVGNSICEDDKVDLARSILNKAKEKGVHLYYPTDVVVADDFSNDANTKIVSSSDIQDGWEGVDAGTESLKKIKEIILQSKTILWNGPLGVFEFDNFAKGTIALATFVEEATANGSFSLVGGGDSVAAVKKFGYQDKVSYVSTGGGAMLEALERKTLPGIVALEK